jgi:Ca2+/H+ antiporter, TMEM165/GDT1 family
MKRFWFKKGLMFLAFFIAAILLFGAIVMELWNAILPAVLGIKAITFIQALGILLLSKILFGGFGRRGGWHGGRHQQWGNSMREKWGNMTPDEREKFKAEWKNRCGRGWKMDEKNTAATAE